MTTSPSTVAAKHAWRHVANHTGRRVVTPGSYTLPIDLAGPFKKGEDQLGRGRYMLVGCFTLPVSKEGRASHLKTEEADDPAHRCGNPRVEGGRTASGEEGAEGHRQPGGEVDHAVPAPGRIEGGIFGDEEEPEEIQQEEIAEDPLQEDEDPAASAAQDEKSDDKKEWSGRRRWRRSRDSK